MRRVPRQPKTIMNGKGGIYFGTVVTKINGAPRKRLLDLEVDTPGDARKLADIFIDETNKYYNQRVISFEVVCLAAEVFVKIAFMDIAADGESRDIIYDHIEALRILKGIWDPPAWNPFRQR